MNTGEGMPVLPLSQAILGSISADQEVQRNPRGTWG